MSTEHTLLTRAQKGDIHAFQQLFSPFQDALKSYLFRLTANRNDAEDLAHDTFIKAFDKLSQFEERASLKTWMFQIATSLALNMLKRKKRWSTTVLEDAKKLVGEKPELARQISSVAAANEEVRYDMKEHIDTCFTCMGKTLPIEEQIVLILKDVYDFKVKEIMLILDVSEGKVKYALKRARETMIEIFNNRCSLVSKLGVCHQCSELNGWFNPQQDQQQALMKLELRQASEDQNKTKLFAMRTALVKNIHPLRTVGAPLQEVLMNCNRMAMGETSTL